MDQLVTTVRQRSWMEMVRQQRSSGQTIKSWCQDNGISENCYYYRLNQLRKVLGNSIPNFAELTPFPQPISDGAAMNLDNSNSTAIITIGNVRVELSNQASSDLIGHILRHLHAE